MSGKLKKEFYTRNLLVVAKELLGKIFVYEDKNSGEKLSGKIVEVEAYDGSIDKAAHTFIGKTERNKIMFENVGFAYVYFTYGMHFCFNVVAKNPRVAAGAVLIRAIKPEKGITIMQENRGNVSLKNLVNGPAKLAQALAITKEHYGIDITKNPKLYISEGIKPKKIIASPRIGIKEATDKLWNFKIKI